MALLDTSTLARMALVFIHLLAFAAATVAVAFGDYAFFGHGKPNPALLQKSAQGAKAALAVLWATGLGLVALDTGMDPAVLATKGKLLAKIAVVSVLSLNGVALHYLVFPRFTHRQRDPWQAAVLPTVLGAISTTSWLFAAFLGASKALAPVPASSLLNLYALALLAATLVALAFFRPRVAARLRGASRPK